MKHPKQTQFTVADTKTLEENKVYQGYFDIKRLKLKHRLFAGGWSEAYERELFERGHAVGVLLYDPVLHQIVLIEQFRVGTLGKTQHPWLLEIVAGIIESDENELDVAKRETQEETGLLVDDLIPICDYWVSPGGTTETVKLYCARVDAKHANGVHGLVEESEDIRVLAFSVAEVYELLEQGKIVNAATIIAVQWFQLHEKMVREKWRI
jgi:ADP-ribose pyrophosphatase